VPLFGLLIYTYTFVFTHIPIYSNGVWSYVEGELCELKEPNLSLRVGGMAVVYRTLSLNSFQIAMESN
jgi:hypothetical protein